MENHRLGLPEDIWKENQFPMRFHAVKCGFTQSPGDGWHCVLKDFCLKGGDPPSWAKPQHSFMVIESEVRMATETLI